RILRQASAWCLQYPDTEVLGRLPQLRAALQQLTSGPAAPQVVGFIDEMRAMGGHKAAQHYVEVFDTTPRRSLHLTWYTDGDTRRRGASLLRLKRFYREHGMELVGEELSDYLPVLLEFA